MIKNYINAFRIPTGLQILPGSIARSLRTSARALLASGHEWRHDCAQWVLSSRPWLGAIRCEGLYPVEHCARGDIDVALRQHLHNMGDRQGITGIPTHGGEDPVSRPAVARESGRGGRRKVTAAWATAVPLTTLLIIPITLRGRLLAGRTSNHGHRVYHKHQLISQTPLYGRYSAFVHPSCRGDRR
jgi:hypothetical protein